MQVDIQQAYAEACQALGEEVVKARLFSKALTSAEELLGLREEAREAEAESGAGGQVADPSTAPGGDASGNGGGDLHRGTDASLGEANGTGSDKQRQHGSNGKVPEARPN